MAMTLCTLLIHEGNNYHPAWPWVWADFLKSTEKERLGLSVEHKSNGRRIPSWPGEYLHKSEWNPPDVSSSANVRNFRPKGSGVSLSPTERKAILLASSLKDSQPILLGFSEVFYPFCLWRRPKAELAGSSLNLDLMLYALPTRKDDVAIS